jgi:hypothetical protein
MDWPSGTYGNRATPRAGGDGQARVTAGAGFRRGGGDVRGEWIAAFAAGGRA